MSGVDIAEFLAARLDEDERVASGAALGPWTYGDIDSVAGGMIYDATVAVADVHYDPEPLNSTVRRRILPSEADGTGEHIARHDPARVLAEVAAKRAVLDEYRWAVKSVVDYPDDRSAVMAKWAFKIAVRAHVQPYADHPDFDPTWALQHA